MDIRALMKQLVEGVFHWSRALPKPRDGWPANRTPVPTDRLAIGLHLRLLEVGRNSMKGLSVRQHHPARQPKRIDIPDFNERCNGTLASASAVWKGP